MFKIVLFGAGGHANSCIDVIKSTEKFDIACLIDDNKNLKNKDYKILPEKNLDDLKKKFKYALIAFGSIKKINLRYEKFLHLKKKGFVFPKIISSISYIADNSKIDEGSIVMHGVIINNSTSIGKNCIINTKALIEHDVKIHDNCHISTGAIINGKVTIKQNTFIGSGSTIFNNIVIGKNCLISAGSIIKKNLPDHTTIK
jgi:sugar O-acyltransferase (sialic acid O-acetyltransferase NeuD family)